jgi:hypothetical protein
MKPGAEGEDRVVGSVNIASAAFMVAERIAAGPVRQRHPRLHGGPRADPHPPGVDRSTWAGSCCDRSGICPGGNLDHFEPGAPSRSVAASGLRVSLADPQEAADSMEAEQPRATGPSQRIPAVALHLMHHLSLEVDSRPPAPRPLHSGSPSTFMMIVRAWRARHRNPDDDSMWHHTA